MQSSSELLNELASLLDQSAERFGNYQDLPDFIRQHFPALTYVKSQLSLDLPRWLFLDNQLNLVGSSVIEIGSNLGYFCLRLAKERGCQVIGFEPIADYAKASSIMANVSGVADLCQFNPRGVTLADIDALPESDLIIELNVLHHAGAVFDHDLAIGAAGWRNYAVARLGKLRQRGRRLFFQTGNSRGAETLFPSRDAVGFLKDILAEAGWKPVSVGGVLDPVNQIYDVFPVDKLDYFPVYDCQRNSDTGLVEYRRDGKLIGQHKTGLAARPVWICE